MINLRSRILLVAAFAIGVVPVDNHRALAQAPPTIEEALAAAHITNTIAALRRGLTNADPASRQLAAGVLAIAKDEGSIPYLHAAFDRETDRQAKIAIAGALATLNEWAGLDALRKMCVDSSLPDTERLTAARHLQDAGDATCLQQVLEIMDNPSDVQVRDLSMQYLRRITRCPPQLLTKLRQILSKELQDEVPMNRQYAGECLSIYGDAGSISAMQYAIATESEKPTRQSLEQNLLRLENGLAVNTSIR